MKTIRCPQCNIVCWTTVSFCNRCNFDISNYLNEQGIDVSENFERSYSDSSARNFSTNSNYGNNSHSDYRNTGSANYQQNSRRESSGYRFNDSSGNYRDSRNAGYQRNNHNYNANTSKGLAIWSLVFGILSMPFISAIITVFIAAILAAFLGTPGAVLGIIIGLSIPVTAIWTGVVSIKRVNRFPAEFGGKGLAIAGICCAAFGLLTVPIVAAIAIPNLLAARKAANEGSAISTMRSIDEAQRKYESTIGVSCADLKLLHEAKMIDPILQNGEKSGFRFATKESSTNNCAITATPIDSSYANRAFYYSTGDKVLRAEKYMGSPATINSKPVDQK